MQDLRNIFLSLAFAGASIAVAGFSYAHENRPTLNSNSYTEFNNSFYILPEHFGKEDDRVKITDYSSQPWSNIGHLDIGYELPCTGGRMDAHVIATAGHCVIGGTVIEIEGLDGDIIIPNSDNIFTLNKPDDLNAEKARVAYYYRPHSYKDKSMRHDFAFAVLEKPIGGANIPFTFANMNLNEIKHMNNILLQGGFSGDAPLDLTANLDCQIIEIDNEHFFHDCDTLAGDSGSPIIIWEQGQYKIAGINFGITTLADNWTLSNIAISSEVVEPHFEHLMQNMDRIQNRLDQQPSLALR